MVMGFEKEEHDLVAKRGLLPDRNNQIFSMAITTKLRNQYSKVMQPLYEVSFFLLRKFNDGIFIYFFILRDVL